MTGGVQKRRNGRRAALMWTFGVSTYLVAVFHRTSLGVAADLAQQRFQIGPTELSTFTVQQLLVYAVLQVPAGLLVDRLGPRRSLTIALGLMAAGQTLFAVATAYPMGLLARGMLGCGDALTFVGVLRLTTAWCEERRIALLVQVTTVLGMAGNLMSSSPLAAALHAFGWTPTFLSTAITTAVLAAVVCLVVRDSPPDRVDMAVSPQSLREAARALAVTWRSPGTRLGLWMTFTASFSFVAFTALWGYSFLTSAQRLSTGTAGWFLTVTVVTTMVTGPLLGQAAARRPDVRLRLCMAVAGLTATAWAVVLAWPTTVPTALLLALVVTIGMSGPAAMLGVDVARTTNPPGQVATAAAVANAGGFAGNLLAIFLIGLGLDLARDLGAAEAFRIALCAQFALYLFGAIRVRRWAKAARAAALPGNSGATKLVE